MTNDFIMVSVNMLTYNHARYIERAIKSVLMQKTSFRFELIIGEDGSSDGTAEIVKQYADKYPDVITAIIHSQNVGAYQNYQDNMAQIKGKYIAILEGDDFWTDENKLQIQIDFLEANKDYFLCYSDTYYIKDHLRPIYTMKRDILSIDDYLGPKINWPNPKLWGIPWGTICFRNIELPKIENRKTKRVGDIQWICNVLVNGGKIKYIPRKMSCYRNITHHKSSFNSLWESDYESFFMELMEARRECREICGDDYRFQWNLIIATVWKKEIRKIKAERKYNKIITIWKKEMMPEEKKAYRKAWLGRIH